jgi:hypothetical protein
MTTSYFYSYIETTAYKTTYTITLKAKPNKWSVMGEIWISNDGKNWGRVGKGWDLYSGPVSCPGFGVEPCDWYVNRHGPGYSESGYSRRYLNGCTDYHGYCLSRAGPPTIAGSNIIAVEKGSAIAYRILYFSNGTRLTANIGSDFWQYKVMLYIVCYYGCYWYYGEWRYHYVPQAIELVDWDTGEVYGSTNSTSFTFQIDRNTIVRFKYVLAESRSYEWTLIPPGPSTPKNCTAILNDQSKVGSSDWCDCARVYLPKGTWEDYCRPETCLTVKVEPCCLEADPSSCVSPWNPGNGKTCVNIPEGSTTTLRVDWSASWGLKPGWVFDKVLKTGVHGGDAKCEFTTYTPDTPDSGYVSGRCSIQAKAGGHYYVTMKIVFRRT